ncbi:PilZ domain-containing protein [bacterium]|nr:PilZ domain-containing protein [bacterium]
MIFKTDEKCLVFLKGKLFRGVIISVVSENEIVLKIYPPFKYEEEKVDGEIYFTRSARRFYAKARFIFINEVEVIVKVLSPILPDRRKDIRIKLYPLSVKLVKGFNEINGEIINISFSGAKIKTDYPLKKGENYKIEIDFGKEIFRGECVVAEVYTDFEVYYGISFENISYKNEEILEKFLKIIEEENEIGFYRIVRKIYLDILGDISTGIHKVSGRNCIIREIKKQLIREDFTKDIDKIRFLSHPNLTKINRIIKRDEYFVIMEEVKGEILSSLIENKGVFSIYSACEIILQILEGINYLEKMGLRPSFILPSGIFIDDNGKIKMFDVIFSSYVDINQLLKLNLKGSFIYSSPFYQIEIPYYLSPLLKKGKEDLNTYFYSIGAVFYKMLSGMLPVRMNRNLPEGFMNLILKLTSAEKLEIEEIMEEVEFLMSGSESQGKDGKREERKEYREKRSIRFKIPDVKLLEISRKFFKNIIGEFKKFFIKYFYFKKRELFKPYKKIILISTISILFLSTIFYWIYSEFYAPVLILQKPPPVEVKVKNFNVKKNRRKEQNKEITVNIKVPEFRIKEEVNKENFEELLLKYKLPVYTIKDKKYISLRTMEKVLRFKNVKVGKDIIFFEYKDKEVLINLRKNEININGKIKKLENPVKTILEEKLISVSTIKTIL